MPDALASRLLVDALDGWSRSATWTFLTCAGLVLVAADRAVPEVGMGPAYIPLIALAGWRLGARAACNAVVAASLLNVVLHAAPEAVVPHAVALVRGVLRVGTYAFVAATVCALRGAYDRERTAARRDFLTGALNRAAFEERARALLAAVPGRGAVAVALVDVDAFKRINDTHGHAAGDGVLRTLVRTAAAALREGDCLGRLGGDEFALLLQAPTVDEAAARTAGFHRSLTDGLARAETASTASMGACVLSPAVSADPGVAMREADRLMYASKASGPGNVRIATFTSPPPVEAMPSTRGRTSGRTVRAA